MTWGSTLNVAFGVDTAAAVTAHATGSKYVAGAGALAGNTENELTPPVVVTVTLVDPGGSGVELTQVPLVPCGSPLVRNDPSIPGTAMLCTVTPEGAPNANPYCGGFAEARLRVTEYALPWPTAVHVSPEPTATCPEADEATDTVRATKLISATHNRAPLMISLPLQNNREQV